MPPSPTLPAGAHHDLLVIGGGINGVALARDAAGRGLKVLLCEAGDLACGTSSRSSRLIHGGLRYLATGQLRLVRESLAERSHLLRSAPHLVRPLPLVLPALPGTRPAWMLRLGLGLYDLLAPAGELSGHRRLAHGAAELDALRDPRVPALAYADCRTQDARLVICTARDAAARGAHIATRMSFQEARLDGGSWHVSLQDAQGRVHPLRARILANVSGPQVAQTAARIRGGPPAPAVRLVQGTHLMVQRPWQGEHGYYLPQADGRAVFVLPAAHGRALVGTTELALEDARQAPAPTEAEIDYLRQAVGTAMRLPLAGAVRAFAGVRCLLASPGRSDRDASRDYRCEAVAAGPDAWVLTVVGGKLTTHRRLAEQALATLAPALPGLRGAWTAGVQLPGGDFHPGQWAQEAARVVQACPSLGQALFDRHGRQALGLVAQADRQGWGEHFGHGLHALEVRHFMRAEWAQSAEDVLERRCDLAGLLDAGQVAALEKFMAAERAAMT